jgi:uncharacterized protein YjeT (DUF2065 family)
MYKNLRLAFGSVLVLAGIVFFILPGSILMVLGGLMLLSYDVPQARNWLKVCQRSMSQSARKLDTFILNRKLRRRT